MTARLGLVIVAAGSSARMRGVDKVWAPLHGRPVLWHSLCNLAPAASTTAVVVRENMLSSARHALAPDFGAVLVVPGGPERRDSVLNGLHAIGPCEYVAVHDAARPLATSRLLSEGLALLERFEGAIPVEPVRDTVKRVEGGAIVETLDRTTLRLAQTPQIFQTAALIAAHEAAGNRVLTDDASALEAMGLPVGTFPGEPWNLKITTPFDLQMAALLASRPPAV